MDIKNNMFTKTLVASATAAFTAVSSIIVGAGLMMAWNVMGYSEPLSATVGIVAGLGVMAAVGAAANKIGIMDYILQ